MLTKKWIVINNALAITFSFPCEKNCDDERIMRANIDRDKPEGKHGHVEVLTLANGCAIVPFCCYSQAGVGLVVTCLKVRESGWKGILDLPEVKELPVHLTELESEKIFRKENDNGR